MYAYFTERLQIYLNFKQELEVSFFQYVYEPWAKPTACYRIAWTVWAV
jgi:hypothetical protein